MTNTSAPPARSPKRLDTSLTPRLWQRAAGLLAAAALLNVGICAAGPTDLAAAELPRVVLSEHSPEAVHYPDGSWAIPIRAPGNQAAPGFVCRGTYINPEIVARGQGTAVHFAAKYFCNRPVSYSVTTGVVSFHEDTPRGPVVPHPAGQASRQGVSQTPYVEGFSPPCKNNLNSGWEPYDHSRIEGDAHDGRGRRVTVGCRV
jgi:hypothetical protein